MDATISKQMTRLRSILEETKNSDWGEQIFQTAPAGLLIVDEDGLIARANHELCNMFGYAVDALTGQSVELILPERYRARHPELQRAYLQTPDKRTMGAGRELYGLCRDGHEIPVEIGLSPVQLSERNLVLATVVDISERKRIEQDFQRIVEAMPNGVLALNPDGEITKTNTELARMFGYEQSELLGKKIETLLPEKYRENHVNLRNNYFLAPEKRFMGEGRDLFGLRKDGTTFPVEIGLNPIPDKHGTSILASVVDTSQRKRHEQIFAQIVEAAPQGMLMIDSNAVITMVNQRLCKLFGYTADEVVGQKIEFLVPERYRESHVGIRTVFIAAPELRPMGKGRDLTAQHRDGTEFPVEIGLNPIETDSGKMILASVTDITQRKNAEHRLHQANADLQEFTSVASHDLRSPLRGISNLLEWIKEDLGDNNSPEVDDHIKRAAVRVKRMDTLITDLLDYARAGQASAAIETIDINSMIDGIFGLVDEDGHFALKKDIRVETMSGSRTPIETCIRNLVNNAIKHHDRPNGVIDISCVEESGFCVFRVADDGPGIAPAVHERIFKLFQTLSKSNDSTGLGLAITKRLVESHGGEISVQSNESSRGTTFEFRWPMFQRRDLERE